MHLWYRSNNFWKAPMEVLLCECVNDLRHSLFHLLNCLITTASELREYPKVTGRKVSTIRRLSNCPDAHLRQIVYDEDRVNNNNNNNNNNNQRKRIERQVLVLIREPKKLWNTRVTVIRFVIGALGTVPKVLERGLEDLEIEEGAVTILTTAVFRLARILRRVQDP